MNSLLYALIVMGIVAFFVGLIMKEFGKQIKEGVSAWTDLIRWLTGKKKKEEPKKEEPKKQESNEYVEIKDNE